MRTTLTIDDDVLAAAKTLAANQGQSIGEVISALARDGLRPIPTQKTRNGVPLLRVKPNGPRVTSELVQELREELV